MMSALNDKLLVVTNGGSRASFMEVGGQGSNQARLHQSFHLERYAGPCAVQTAGGMHTSPLVSIHLVAEYIVAVYETKIVILKQSGELLQEIENRYLNPANSQNRFRYVKGAVNISGDHEVVLLASNTKDTKSAMQSQVLVLREKDPQEQINELLGKGQINEAQAVFA